MSDKSEILDEIKSLRLDIAKLRHEIDRTPYTIEKSVDRLTKLFLLAFGDNVLGNLGKSSTFKGLESIVIEKFDKIFRAYSNNPLALQRLSLFKDGECVKFMNPRTGENNQVQGISGLVQLSFEEYLSSSEFPTVNPFLATIEILLTGIAMGDDDENYDDYLRCHARWAEHSKLE